MTEKKEPTIHIKYLSFVIAGIILIVGALASPDILRYMILTIMGIVISVFGCINIIFDIDALNRFQKLQKAKQGIVWVWLVALIAIVILTIGWFALWWPTLMIIEIVEDSYSFPSSSQMAINLVKTVGAWFLIIMVIGFLAWALVNSMKRQEPTYPYE